jgi:DNA-binding transcriptional LysR family regulator
MAIAKKSRSAMRFRITEVPSWELYRTLLSVIREGSLSGAARALNLTQPTAGRHIDALEESLGRPLFSRSPSGLHPTDAALALVPHAEAMANAAEALIRTASGEAEDEGGSVRLTTTEIVGAEVIAPLLPRFRKAYPRIAIELLLSSRTEDLLRREADIAVRLFRPTQTALMATHVGNLTARLHAHRDYIEEYGAPRTVEDLSRHSLIGFDSEALIQRYVNNGYPFVRDAFSLRCDSYLGQYAAVRAGFGIGSCLTGLAKRDGLIPVLVGRLPDVAVETWLVMHHDLRTTRRVRLLYDFLAEHLSDYARK